MIREERIEKFNEVLNTKFIRPFVHGTCGYIDGQTITSWLEVRGYFDAPASAHHHGANAGDLFMHSLAVAETLDDYTRKLGLEWERRNSPWIVGLFHDLCKIDQYIPSTEGWIWNDKQLITGHGDKSVMLLSMLIPPTKEEILCIRYHMGAYNKEDWNGFDLAIRKYPNVLYTHMADMYASKVMDI